MNNTSLVSLCNGVPSTTSLKVADVFHKRHADVIRSISGILSQVPEIFGKRNFALNEYTQKNAIGEKRLPMYTMTRDGFTLLVMGYTGKEAMRFKLEYIEAFNAMERELMKASSHLSPDLRAELKALVDAKLSMVPEDVQGKARAELWTRFDRYFKIAEYAQLPASKMPEAREYIINLELRALRGAESQETAHARKALPKPKECTLTTNRKEIEAMQKKLELLCQTVQLTGLSSTTLGGERAERLLTESRNRHVRTAVNCLIMANMALEYAIA